MISSSQIFREGHGEATVLPKSTFDPIAFAREAALERKRLQEETRDVAAEIQSKMIGEGWEQDMDEILKKQSQIKGDVVNRLMSGEISPQRARAMYNEQIEPLARRAAYQKQQKEEYNRTRQSMGSAVGMKNFDLEEMGANLEAWRTGRRGDENLIPEGMSKEEWRNENRHLLTPVELYNDQKYISELGKTYKPTVTNKTEIVKQGDKYVKVLTPSIDYSDIVAMMANETAKAKNGDRKATAYMAQRYKEADELFGFSVDNFGSLVLTKNKPRQTAAESVFVKQTGRRPENVSDWIMANEMIKAKPEKVSSGDVSMYGSGDIEISIAPGSEEANSFYGVTQSKINWGPDGAAGELYNSNLSEQEIGTKYINTSNRTVYAQNPKRNKEIGQYPIARAYMLTSAPVAKKDVTVSRPDGSVHFYKRDEPMSESDADIVGGTYAEYRAVALTDQYQTENDADNRRGESVPGFIGARELGLDANQSSKDMRVKILKRIEYLEDLSRRKNDSLKTKKYWPVEPNIEVK